LSPSTRPRAGQIAERCALDGFDVPPSLQGLIAAHGSKRPLALPLRTVAEPDEEVKNYPVKAIEQTEVS